MLRLLSLPQEVRLEQLPLLMVRHAKYRVGDEAACHGRGDYAVPGKRCGEPHAAPGEMFAPVGARVAAVVVVLVINVPSDEQQQVRQEGQLPAPDLIEANVPQLGVYLLSLQKLYRIDMYF